MSRDDLQMQLCLRRCVQGGGVKKSINTVFVVVFRSKCRKNKQVVNC